MWKTSGMNPLPPFPIFGGLRKPEKRDLGTVLIARVLNLRWMEAEILQY